MMLSDGHPAGQRPPEHGRPLGYADVTLRNQRGESVPFDLDGEHKVQMAVGALITGLLLPAPR